MNLQHHESTLLSFRTGLSPEESAVSTTLSPAFVIDELAASRILTLLSFRAKRGICCRGQFIRIAGQQVPGFAVFLIRSTVDSLLASRVKMNEFTVKNGIHWNHIPGVE